MLDSSLEFAAKSHVQEIIKTGELVGETWVRLTDIHILILHTIEDHPTLDDWNAYVVTLGDGEYFEFDAAFLIGKVSEIVAEQLHVYGLVAIMNNGDVHRFLTDRFAFRSARIHAAMQLVSEGAFELTLVAEDAIRDTIVVYPGANNGQYR